MPAPADLTNRSDVVPILDEALAQAVESTLAQRKDEAAARGACTLTGKPDPQAVARRRDFIESAGRDPNGFERILGRSDLLSINFLDRGQRSSRAVCRIATPLPGGGVAYGTGFLVAPRLLLTNNHVIANADEATQSEAQFGYEHDLDGVLAEPASFNLAPGELFYTSRECDFTLVAVAALSSGGVPLDRYGWLPLLPRTDKALDGEWVTIIQHPNGEPKQIAIHASQMIRLDPTLYPEDGKGRFTHYTTDTEPGSSGSPVLNDQWQVVALHHKAVPAAASLADPAAGVKWVANEGVRVTAIFRQLERDRFQFGDAGKALDRLSRGIGFAPLAIAVEDRGVAQNRGGEQEQYAPFKPERWQDPALGYDPDFLGADAAIPLAPIYADLAGQGVVAPLDDGSHELKYFHYSAVMHAVRRFPLFTVVNIDGEKLIHPGERKDTWRPDGRLDRRFQSDDAFYSSSKNLPPEPVYFSRGHLVRLLDPCWGDSAAEARRGMEDTFHFTNAAPQVQKYNDIDWGNLEDYLLDKAQTSERKLTVFTGPVYRADDPPWGRTRPGGPWQIPLSYWKVAVLKKAPGDIAAAAFLIGQSEYVEALYEAKVFSGLKPYSPDQIRSRKLQTTVKVIEEITGLDFAAVRGWDAHGGLESTRQTRWFEGLEDVMI